MRKVKLDSKLVISIVLYVLIGFGLCYFFTNDWTGRQTVFVFLTGIIVIWYTWETQKLRENSSDQIKIQSDQMELQIRPFVVLDLEKPFPVINIGNGVALNVELRDAIVDYEKNVIIKFPQKIPVLKSGEKQQIQVETFRNNAAEDFFAAHLDPRYANRQLTIIIEYDNINLKRYAVSEQTAPQAVRIIGFKSL